MTQGPQAPKTLYGLQYYINPKVGADLGLPLTTNPINFSAMLENGLSANAWGVCVEKSGDIFIYCRDHMKQVKISLHKSGMQFVAFTKPGTKPPPSWACPSRPSIELPRAKNLRRFFISCYQFHLALSLFRPQVPWWASDRRPGERNVLIPSGY